MKRFLAHRGLVVNSPRETFRVAAAEGLIDNPEVWFDFIKKRNITTHTYEEKEVEEIIAILPLFSQEATAFLKKIGA